MSEPYHDPVAQLLTLGDPRQEGRIVSEWCDYPALGLTAEHVPELVRMALDDDLHWCDWERAEVWAPLHAWRALGQLRAESAVEPLRRVAPIAAEIPVVLVPLVAGGDVEKAVVPEEHIARVMPLLAVVLIDEDDFGVQRRLRESVGDRETRDPVEAFGFVTRLAGDIG